MTYPIETGIPITLHRGKYPWATIQPTESFFVPATKKTVRKVALSLAACMKSQRRLHGKKFTQRVSAEPCGVRVWRVS